MADIFPAPLYTPRLVRRTTPRFDPPNLSVGTLLPVQYVPRMPLVGSPIRRPIRYQRFDVGSLLTTTLAVKPFDQKDWPNPVRRRYVAPVDQILNNISRLVVPNTKPFDYSDWENPVRRRYAAPVDQIINELVLGFPIATLGGGDDKQFIGEIQFLGVSHGSVILDASMGIT